MTQPETSEVDECVNATELNKIITEFKDKPLKSLIRYIRKHLLLKKTDVLERKQLVKCIEDILCNNGLCCKLYMFGSTKTWLGLRSSSDIDIFAQIFNEHGEPIDEDEMSYTKNEQILHSIADIVCNQQADLGFDVDSEVICHRHMRVPITRLNICPPTKTVLDGTEVVAYKSDPLLHCDINVNNALGISNTSFIQFLCKFEPRFFVLTVLLRLWAKYVAFLNKPVALTSYAITNLVLFYFQKCTPPILPPVDYFIQLSNKKKIVNNWRCDFCKDLQLIDFQSKNIETVFQLLIGFFKFYEKFQFEGVKISTRYAKTWKLKRWSAEKKTPIHLMDPFEQSHNLTSRIKDKVFKRFKVELNCAIERYQKYLK